MSTLKQTIKEVTLEQVKLKIAPRNLAETGEEIRREREKDHKDMNKKWGGMANKIGTIIEGIVVPNIPAACIKYFGLHEPLQFSSRIGRRDRNDRSRPMEMDVLAVYDTHTVFCEAKGYVRIEYMNWFIWSFCLSTIFSPN